MTAPTTETNLDLADNVKHIQAEDAVWVRVAAQLVDQSWAVRVLELTSGDEPTYWRKLAYDYPEVWFRTVAATGEEAGKWLETGQVSLDGISAALPDLSERSGWLWRASRESFGLSPLLWPSWQVELAALAQMNEPRGPFVGDTVFRTFYEATSYVFSGGQGPPGGQVIPAIRYRHQDTSGRIESLDPRADSVHVTLIGRRLVGMALTLAGRVPGPSHQIEEQDDNEAVVALPYGDVPLDDAWVVLREGTRRVDQRTLSRPDHSTASALASLEFQEPQFPTVWSAFHQPQHRPTPLIHSSQTEFLQPLAMPEADELPEDLETWLEEWLSGT